MLQVGRDFDLFKEPLGSEDRGQLGPQYLDRDLAMVFQVLGEIHRRHAAGTRFFFNGIAVG